MIRGSMNRYNNRLHRTSTSRRAAEDRQDWEEWIAFFSRTREPDGRRKGVVEVEL